jgi:glycosyltransferase involved in cell wall biosynthesis
MDVREQFDISVIVPVGERQSDPKTLFADYRAGLAKTGLSAEFIYVVDGQFPAYTAALEELASQGAPITIVLLSRTFGEATAVSAGFERATAPVIVTLPAHAQISADHIRLLVDQLGTVDLAIARRWPRIGGVFERMRRGIFHGLLSRVTHLKFHDLGCSARAMKRRVLEEIALYGDQQRFLPVLADRQGFRVAEIDIPQATNDRRSGVYGPRAYTRGFLDIFTVFFLVRFTKKPLRFFGMIGVITFAIGALAQIYMVIERLFLQRALADRPAFLVATLFIVMGLQIFALGLLGELIIFVHAGGTKDYQVDRVIQFPARGSEAPLSQNRVAANK